MVRPFLNELKMMVGQLLGEHVQQLLDAVLLSELGVTPIHPLDNNGYLFLLSTVRL